MVLHWILSDLIQNIEQHGLIPIHGLIANHR